jgi:glycosyltransferase involved in cell wall biosynthesis
VKVSVVICSYSEELYEHLVEAVESILSQTYDDVEVVVVVDGNDELYSLISSNYAEVDEVHLVLNDENLGLSASRNVGVKHSTGDVVAFMDDDAVADEQWVEELVLTYEEHGVEAAGGQMTPIWVAGKPSFLPEEFYWLIGVTHRGFPDEGEVRNTFGSNISFRRDVLENLDGFDEELGRKGDRHVQGEETELAARMRDELGGTLYYNPEAKVGHKVFEYRTSLVWLLKRAFWQGYSKRAMEKLVSDGSIGEESKYLSMLLFDATPRHLRFFVTRPAFSVLGKFVMLYLLTACVGFGYLYALATYR